MSALLFGSLAAVGSSLAFGSFGVPIKSQRVLNSKVHPLVFQSYKTFACFATAWLVLLWTDFHFTWWGTVGAAIWVVNGVMAIIAIQKAGLAISQALWSGLSIFVSFLWGTLVFHEPIHRIGQACAGLVLMAAGLAGIGFAARPAPPRGATVMHKASDGSAQLEAVQLNDVVATMAVVEAPATPVAADRLDGTGRTPAQQQAIGLACGAYVGVANGSFMVPLKYASAGSVKGIEYVVSFGIGAALVTTALMLGYTGGRMVMRRGPPELHIRAVGPAALLAGLLWSIGNLLGIYATLFLGLAIGFPLIQCQVIVSGLWGICLYQEMKCLRRVLGFAVSTVVILAGVFLLTSCSQK